MKKFLRYSLVGLMALVSGSVTAQVVSDSFTKNLLDSTSNGYQDLSNVALNSSARYKLNAASNYGKWFQLRSKDSNSGVVTTTTGGVAKTVTVVWYNDGKTSNAKGRTIDIYGKNEPYAAVSDLYSDSEGTQGKKIGSVVYANAETLTASVSLEGNYAYVGFRSKSGALYTESITIDWSGEASETKLNAGLEFSPSNISLKVGEAFKAPKFTKATTADVKFTSDNEAVATVDANGVITLAGELGTANIKATSEENSDYYAGTATCQIKVYDVNTYKKATAVSSDNFLLVAQRDDKTYYAYPLGETKPHGYLSTGSVTGYVDQIEVDKTYNDEFTFTAVDGGYTIQDSYGRYLYQSKTYNSFNLSDTNKGYVWTVEPQTDGTFKISMNGYFMQFGEGTFTSFGAYDSAQDNAVLPMLYTKVSDAIKNVTTVVERNDANAPIFNLAGQRVGKDYKGVVIQNGKKYLNK
ncbi:MAG: Ig-like domain-containing protein [Prevotella sp.]|nr:Ig-like domain-containing protein [Prevotella sp.]